MISFVIMITEPIVGWAVHQGLSSQIDTDARIFIKIKLLVQN